jgi:hypothetical protein
MKKAVKLGWVVLWLLSGLTIARSAQAVELGLGLTAIEEGDDRMRYGVLGHVGFAKDYFTRGFYYGRKYGPIIERTGILSLGYKLNIFQQFGTQFAYAGFGLTAMNERTELKFAGDSENSTKEDNFNMGFLIGVYADIPIPGPIFLKAAWESHVFLAGLSGILLSNGRKQMMSLTTGVEF